MMFYASYQMINFNNTWLNKHTVYMDIIWRIVATTMRCKHMNILQIY